MSVQTEINRITQNIENTYAALEALGCDIPEAKTSDNLAPTAGTAKVVKYTEQTLTDAQKAQARTNIDAASETKVSQLEKQIDDLNESFENGELNGVDGKDGYTPQKGIDYFTTSDKTEMVNLVLNALPIWTGGSY